ncbi:uncharacterized protein LOC120412958 [Culex pipiens pallens]|uniref:uncharacterized protein LOC120412958 n=1 Tax=Culex pipiens pallens TaxID=42434 RepID=UPI0019537D44|nr:uncharacterized protein LOC120412958 [Culex pipiens pallens]
MGAKMSRRKGRKAAAAAEKATPEIRVDETDSLLLMTRRLGWRFKVKQILLMMTMMLT